MTEYVIIVALIAVSAIGVYTSLGETLRNQTAGLAKEIAGQDAKDALASSKSSSSSAATKASTTKGLGNFNADNH